jgi:hypothetical protein
MPDTGAPWNIPYVDPTDLVRDYPQASEDLADAIALGLSAAGNPGIGSNVVQTVKTDTFTTSSTSFTPITGLTATITPTSATSKILIIADLKISGGEHSGVRLTGGNAADYIGDADGSRTRVAGGVGSQALGGLDTREMAFAVSLVYLDSPNSASAVTYGLDARKEGSFGAFQLNRSDTNLNNSQTMLYASSITVIEVAV